MPELLFHEEGGCSKWELAFYGLFFVVLVKNQPTVSLSNTVDLTLEFISRINGLRMAITNHAPTNFFRKYPATFVF